MKITNKVVLVLIALVGLCLFPFSNLIGNSNDRDSIVLSKDNTVVLNSQVDGDSGPKIITKTKILSLGHSHSAKPIYLFMNTPGGDIQVGLEIIEALNGLGRKVSTITLFAASMGFQIVQNLNERLILKNGVLMSHRAQGQFGGFFGGKKGSQIDKRYGFWLNRLRELDLQTVKRTNGKQTLESYQDAYADELWLTGSEAVDGGYADRVVTVRCDKTLEGTTSHTVSFLGLQITYELDNCPINTSPMNIQVALPSDKRNAYTDAQLIDVKNKFLEQYLNKQHDTVPMRW